MKPTIPSKRAFIIIQFAVAALLSMSCTSRRAKSNSLLWRISGNGLSKPSYVFGVLDYICPDDYVWTKSMEKCLAECDKVALPINPNDTAVKRQANEAMKDTGGKKLDDYFTSADLAIVDRYAKDSLHLNLSKIQFLKPMAIQPMIIKQLLRCADATSYTATIITKTQKANKKILTIASVAEIMEDVDKYNFNEKIAATLVEMARGSSYWYEYRKHLVSAYQKQDIEGIYALIKEDKLWSVTDQKNVLNKSNRLYASRMPAMMQQSSVFFPIIALNMGGDDGILNLLSKAGYTVEPVFDNVEQ